MEDNTETNEGQLSNDRAGQYYAAELNDNLSAETRELLETYSHIPPDQVVHHVHDVRDKAWAIWKYPCIGQWRFLELAIGKHPLYKSDILPRMKTGDQIFLDLGCAFGQNIRRLVADGVDSNQCYASDLRLDFIELGYQLFNDKDSLKSHFIAADVFDEDSALKDLYGKVDIIEASSFFHLFSWDQQKTVARRVSKLLKPPQGTEGSLLVGRQIGHSEPNEQPRRDGSGSRYRHNLESWRKMWKEVGEEAGVQYEVEGSEWPIPWAFRSFGHIGLTFSVKRL